MPCAQGGALMRVAILGTRGIPARYGGFETFAEELAARLAAAGHEVAVYTRTHTAVPGVTVHRGAAVRRLPALRFKALETLSHTLLSCLDVSRASFDVVLLCNAANAPLLPLLHARGLPVALNVDGLERKRRKWGLLGRGYYRACEGLAARWADALVTDARVIRRYYRRAWKRESVMIPYGGDLPVPTGDEVLRRFGLQDCGYTLYVSRFEPENNPDRVIASYREVPGNMPLVMVGGAPYAEALIRRVRALAAEDRRVVLAGPIYGEGYRQLLFHARAYIHATEVGGTHPALVEAMGAGRVVFFLDNMSNREVVGNAGVPFSFTNRPTLTEVLADYLGDPRRAECLGAAARARVKEHYRWDDVAAAYERLLEGLCSGNPRA
jgi:glycosyltransferase involved in cell wall biosynthesis